MRKFKKISDTRSTFKLVAFLNIKNVQIENTKGKSEFIYKEITKPKNQNL